MNICGISTTQPKRENWKKGESAMYSICIKFKERSNWRPMCRQFESENACHEFVNEAFSRWPVKHVSVFVNGAFCNCFYMSPKRCAEIRASLEKLNYNKTRLFSHYAL